MDSSNFKIYKDKESRIFDDVSNNSEMSKKLEIPFHDLPLKVSNILRRNKLNDLDQLIGLEEKDYLALINFGSKAYSELKNSFESLGLKIPITSQQLKKLFPGCEINSESEEDFQKKFIEFKIPYEKLGFPSEISDTLKWFGFFDLSDLIGLEEKDFLNFKDIDKKSLEETKILLDSYGIKYL